MYFAVIWTLNLKIFPNHGRIFTWRQSSDHSIELWKHSSLKLIVESSRGFKIVTCYMRYWCIILKFNTRNRMWNLKNTLCTQCLYRWRFHAKSVFFFDIFSGDMHFLSGDLPYCWSGSWRRYNLKCVCSSVNGDMASLSLSLWVTIKRFQRSFHIQFSC